MKTKKVELNVDYIGDQTSLTKEEEKALSEYLKKNKIKKHKKSTRVKTAKQLTR